MVVTGAEILDGMCRPERYQDFVFVNGRYAGTLSPILMNSRSDCAAVAIEFPASNKISAMYRRYDTRDARCCPSHTSRASYEIRYQGTKPLVVMTSVLTTSE